MGMLTDGPPEAGGIPFVVATETEAVALFDQI